MAPFTERDDHGGSSDSSAMANALAGNSRISGLAEKWMSGLTEKMQKKKPDALTRFFY